MSSPASWSREGVGKWQIWLQVESQATSATSAICLPQHLIEMNFKCIWEIINHQKVWNLGTNLVVANFFQYLPKIIFNNKGSRKNISLTTLGLCPNQGGGVWSDRIPMGDGWCFVNILWEILWDIGRICKHLGKGWIALPLHCQWLDSIVTVCQWLDAIQWIAVSSQSGWTCRLSVWLIFLL